MSPPTGVEFGKVSWVALRLNPDGRFDLDEEPDALAAEGEVTFTATVPHVLVPGSNPPATLFLPPQTYGIGTDGVMRDQEARSQITLVATNSAGIEPKNWKWQATFRLDSGLVLPPVTFELLAGTTLDLTALAPVPTPS